MEESDPPFVEFYKNLFDNQKTNDIGVFDDVEECEVPTIDLSQLHQGGREAADCKREIAEASQKWGFFQVINHGVSLDVLEKMRCEQMKVFKKTFYDKANNHCNLNFPAGSYRWGTPSATCLRQLAWSEAFHIPLTDISNMGGLTSLSTTMDQFAMMVSNLAENLAEILAEQLGHKSNFFKENCWPSTCYLRLNRYPPCPVPSQVFGLMPHTDSDFLTILHQDQIGGLQLVKDGKWIAVKPKKEALIINIGDLFQAWSNDVYKSVEHRVVANKHRERFSVAYFFCPSYDTVIQSCVENSIYKKFSFREFRQQVQDDVKRLGYKIGLPRFIL
ncbi:gibberellin 2-beta-dioxygenase 8-like isoform X1 [Cynara cardunculus var. scolymus]|uniref:gibberellin 2-beta-dioxygenase 8-like isoform X1 n=1 Tax=Cynara cardunculus var. scolymus TaxID=59895 RepID=UPI000D628508|nr:gibberellin 2-beta-dioxygenase 8-like isoform X1 [Cynara cardunculus var. scolymus]